MRRSWVTGWVVTLGLLVGFAPTASRAAAGAAPTASIAPSPGTYWESVEVTLAAADESDPSPVVHYTLDGSVPTAASAAYGEPLRLSSTTTVRYLAVDRDGNAGVAQGATYTLRHAPRPTGADIETAENKVATTQIAHGDPDAGDAHLYAISQPAGNGTATVDNLGKATYTPRLYYVGGDNFTVKVTDQHDRAGFVTIAVSVSRDTKPPQVTIAPAGGTFQEQVTVTLSAVDDTDPYTRVYYTTNGTAPDFEGNATVAVYGSALTLTSTTTVKYFARDHESNASPVREATFVVRHAPRPTAPPMRTTVGEEGASRVVHGDPDAGDTHSYAVTSAPAHGVAQVDADGLVTYRPDPGFAGDDRLAVTVTDALGATGVVEIPVGVSITLSVAPRVATGASHVVVLRSDGSLWAWGKNSMGQLGDGTTEERRAAVPVGLRSDWVAVAAGTDHSVALRSDGSLWAWGWNYYGQLGIGSTLDRHAPSRVGDRSDWAAVSAGGRQTLALDADGGLWAWGADTYGEGTEPRLAPARVGAATGWARISAGSDHSLALRADGSLWAWGHNSRGQLGDGTTEDRDAPVQVGLDTDWVAAAAGSYGSFALKADGTLWSWGLDNCGQLGNGTLEDRYLPERVGTDDDWVFVEGRLHVLALKADGTLWSWGWGDYGQLGYPPRETGSGYCRTFSTSPWPVGEGDDWTGASAGADFSVGLRADGALWSWGWNGYGQLGRSSAPTASEPTRITALDAGVDAAAPTVDPSPAPGPYELAATVRLRATDDSPARPVIHYTADGSEPTLASEIYRRELLLTSSATLRFLAVDAWGNASSPVDAEYTLTGDVTPPRLTLTTWSVSTAASEETVSGTVEPGAALSVEVDTDATVGPLRRAAGGPWSCTLSGLSDGANTVTATAVDAAGNRATAQAVITVDRSAPVLALDPVPPLLNSRRVTVTGTAEPGATVSASVGAPPVPVSVQRPTADAWRVELTELGEGDTEITVTADDGLGNRASLTAVISVDTVPPLLRIDPPETPTGASGQTLTGTVEAGALVRVVPETATAGEVTWLAPTRWSCALSGLVEGDNGVAVSATDAAGNTATARTAVVRARAPAAGAPGTPSLPTRDPDGSYAVSWAASATAAANYELQEATDAGFTAGLRTAYAGAGLSAPIAGRAAGATYFYRVRAAAEGYAPSAWIAGGNGCAVSAVTLTKWPSKPLTASGASGTITFRVAGDGPVVVAAGADADWITLRSDAVATYEPSTRRPAKGSLLFAVSENPTSAPRDATLTVGGETVSIRQLGSPCRLKLSLTSRRVGASGESVDLVVTTPAGCRWEAAVGDPSWVEVAGDETGVGPGTVTYTVSPNATGKGRSGRLTVSTVGAQPQRVRRHKIIQAGPR